LASSLTALFQQTLNTGGRSGFGLSELERQVLTRAVDSGSISAADYELVFSSYTACMAQHGITGVTWTKAADGAYYPPAIDYRFVSFTSDRWEGADEACQADLYWVQQMYQTQQDNPGLLADQDQAIVACLRRAGLVDAAYTAEDFTSEWDEWASGTRGTVSFDMANPVANACMASQGYVYIKINP